MLNTPARNADAVADLTIAYMLMSCRHLPEAIKFLHQDGIEVGDMGRMGMAFETFQGNELWDKTIGLVGLGAIGRKVAQRLVPFGAWVLGYDPYLDPTEAALLDLDLVHLDTLLATCDIVSLHAPVTTETRGMIGTQQIAMMKKGATLINTARAALLDEGALNNALESGHLGSAALDVFSIEPPGSDHPLLRLPNLIATPHIGGNTHEVASHQGWIVKNEIERILRGQAPEHILNPETLDGFSWTSNRKQLTTESLAELARKPGPEVSDLQLSAPQIQEESKPSSVSSSEQITQTKQGGLLSKVREVLVPSEKDRDSMRNTMNIDTISRQIENILTTFIDLTVKDQNLLEFARKRDFCMYFVLNDINREFYLHFADGAVKGDLRAPSVPPDLTLKMKTEILDGMLTGRLNATRAAMTGKISFSGDTRKAMAMQKVQKDLTRLYTQAREKIGDPGDLTAINPIETQATGEERKEAIQVPRSIPPSSDERDEILSVLNELYASGLITSTGGNISARMENDPSQAWITPSQIFKGNLRAEMMVRIDLDGKSLDEDALSASSERMVHCAIYRRRSDIQAVIHTHAPNTTILDGWSEIPADIDRGRFHWGAPCRTVCYAGHR